MEPLNGRSRKEESTPVLSPETSPDIVLKYLEDCIAITQKTLMDLEKKITVVRESQSETKQQYEVTTITTTKKHSL